MKRRTNLQSYQGTKFFFVELYSENVRRPLKENFGEWFVPKYVSAESVSEKLFCEFVSEKIFCGSESEKKVFGSATLVTSQVNK
jgi:hypothetical protein